MIEIIKKTKIDFMGKRRFVLPFSVLLIIIGFIAIIQIARGGGNLGIDFAGGTAVQIKFNESIPLQDVRKTLVDGGITEFDLQDLTSENKILIRIKMIILIVVMNSEDKFELGSVPCIKISS